MAKRKRYTIQQLIELEAKWQGRVIRAAMKLEEYSRRKRRALRSDEKTRSPKKTVDEIAATLEPSPAYERTVDVLSVPCMTCDVGPRAQCLREGKTIAPHKSRVTAATKAAAGRA